MHVWAKAEIFQTQYTGGCYCFEQTQDHYKRHEMMSGTFTTLEKYLNEIRNSYLLDIKGHEADLNLTQYLAGSPRNRSHFKLKRHKL